MVELFFALDWGHIWVIFTWEDLWDREEYTPFG